MKNKPFSCAAIVLPFSASTTRANAVDDEMATESESFCALRLSVFAASATYNTVFLGRSERNVPNFMLVSG